MGKPTIICDIDGTLADVSGIRHYVTDDPNRRNFTKFHNAASYVHPMPMVVELVQALYAQGFTIVILTSRRNRWYYQTFVWLRKWDIPFHFLGMRADDDDRRDDAVKRDLYEFVVKQGLTPVLAIDDNPIVIHLWRSLDIPTVVVPGWDLTPDKEPRRIET